MPVLVKDVNPSTASSFPHEFADVGGTLFYTVAESGSLHDDLWKSDGTEAGTVLVKDIYPGAESSVLEGFVDLDGTLVFAALSVYGDVTSWSLHPFYRRRLCAAFALKRVLTHGLATGHILSVTAEAVFPTGDADAGRLRFYAGFSQFDCKPAHLPLFARTPREGVEIPRV